MSLLSVLSSGLSALQASQTGLRVASQNIANVDTASYARVEVSTSARFAGDAGGVDVQGLRRAADRFLSAAVLSAESGLGAQSARAELLDRAQATFGDPSDANSTFGLINRAFSTLTTAANDPSSSLHRSRVLEDTKAMFAELGRVGGEVERLRREADVRIGDVTRDANTLLSRVADLNREIQTTVTLGGDASSAENAQDQALDQLAELLDIRANPRRQGGLELRTAAGDLLVGETAQTLRYTAPSDPTKESGVVEILDAAGRARPLEIAGRGGLLGGLVQARDRDLPELADAIGQLAAQAADALNAAHNDSSTVPAPNALVGRPTGLAETDPLRFTGGITIGLTDRAGANAGALARRIEVDLSGAGRIRVDGGAWAAIPSGASGLTAADLRTALSPYGVDLSVDGATGAFTLAAADPNRGVMVRQGAEGIPGADRAGRGFAHFLGLNDLVSRPSPIFHETGFALSDSGFPAGAGRELALTVRDASGRVVATPRVAAPGGTIGDMITATRAALGGFGALSFDAATGAARLEPAAGLTIEVTSDGAERNGQSFSALFGLGAAARADRATELTVRPTSGADLAFARPDLSRAIDARVLESGDSTGLRALAAAKDATRRVPAAGGLPSSVDSLASFAAAVGGLAGRKASEAESAQETSRQVRAAALERRDTAQRVNLDEELTRMTQYQQAYAAAARVMQAASEMLDVLLEIV